MGQILYSRHKNGARFRLIDGAYYLTYILGMPEFSCSIEIVASELFFVITTDTDPMLTYPKVVKFTFSLLTTYPMDNVRSDITGDIQFGNEFFFKKLENEKERITEEDILEKEKIKSKSSNRPNFGNVGGLKAGASSSRTIRHNGNRTIRQNEEQCENMETGPGT